MAVGDAVETEIDLPSENDGETRATWVDMKSTIVKIDEERGVLVYSEANDKTA